MRAIVNKTKTILASVMVAFFGGYGIYFAVTKSWLPAAVFLAVAVLFGFVLVRYGSVLHIDDEKLELKFLGLSRKAMPWSRVREFGLIGENVFNGGGSAPGGRSAPGGGFAPSGKKKKTGDKYLYFSPEKLDADERFQMIVKWPPKDKLYAEYSEKLLAYAMTIWGKELETYNVEDLYANTSEPKGSARR